MTTTRDLDEIFDPIEASLCRYSPPLAARTGTELDDDLEGRIDEAVAQGFELYRERGWI
jgi:hypothetical protein